MSSGTILRWRRIAEYQTNVSSKSQTFTDIVLNLRRAAMWRAHARRVGKMASRGSGSANEGGKTGRGHKNAEPVVSGSAQLFWLLTVTRLGPS